MSLTKKPMNPITRKPAPVCIAILENSGIEGRNITIVQPTHIFEHFEGLKQLRKFHDLIFLSRATPSQVGRCSVEIHAPYRSCRALRSAAPAFLNPWEMQHPHVRSNRCLQFQRCETSMGAEGAILHTRTLRIIGTIIPMRVT